MPKQDLIDLFQIVVSETREWNRLWDNYHLLLLETTSTPEKPLSYDEFVEHLTEKYRKKWQVVSVERMIKEMKDETAT